MSALSIALGLTLLAPLAGLADPAPRPARPQAQEREKARPQIEWVGDYRDALVLARERDQPVLVCFNMDGESANDHSGCQAGV